MRGAAALPRAARRGFCASAPRLRPAPLLRQAAPERITYFGIKGVQVTSLCCLEIGGLEYAGRPVAMEEWAALKPTTPTGVLPFAELPGGRVLVESGAIKRVCAAAAGLIGEGDDYAVSEMLCGLCDDWSKKMMEGCPTLMSVKSWTPEQTKKAREEVWPKVRDHAAAIEKFLIKPGDRFTAGGCTLGELEVWYRIYTAAHGPFPEILDGGLRSFYDRVSAVPGVKKVVDGGSKFGAIPNWVQPLPA